MRSASSPLRTRWFREAPSVQGARRWRIFDRLLLVLPLVSITYLAKLSVPPFGEMGIALGIPLVFAIAGLGVLMGRMVFDVRRTVVFLAMFGLLAGIQLFYIDIFSLPSLFLFIVIHAPYVVRLARPEGNRSYVLEYFQGLTLIIALCGIFQYGAQFVIGPILAFPIENFVPSFLLMSKFNSQAVLEYGSDIVRTNGIFMLEPSFLSQLLAIGIVLEVATRKRIWYLAIISVAILVSYSGTGLMLLAFCLLFEAISQRKWAILIGIAAVGAVVLGLASIQEGGILNQILGRSGEFESKGSSGSMRFVGGFYMFEQFLWPDPMRTLFGFGAGSFVEYGGRSNVPVAEMILFKTIFEFGVVGAAVYWTFLIYCIVTSTGLGGARFAVVLAILMGGLYMPFGHSLAFGLLLWAGPASRIRSANRIVNHGY